MLGSGETFWILRDRLLIIAIIFIILLVRQTVHEKMVVKIKLAGSARKCWAEDSVLLVGRMLIDSSTVNVGKVLLIMRGPRFWKKTIIEESSLCGTD